MIIEKIELKILLFPLSVLSCICKYNVCLAFVNWVKNMFRIATYVAILVGWVLALWEDWMTQPRPSLGH